MSLSVRDTKLADTVASHRAGMRLRAHFPAHQGRLALPGSIPLDQLQLDARYLDLGKLRAAEQLVAENYGTRHSCFLSNGGSQGLLTAMLCAARVGARIALPLNAHVAAMHGVVLAGLEPVFIPSVGASPTADELLDFLSNSPPNNPANNPGVQSLLITNPSYDGSAIDLQAVLNRCRELGVLSIVDEVHGTHLHWFDNASARAIALGADLVIHSTHKYAGALTQSALLHITKSCRMSVAEVTENLMLFGTTSRSNLINLSTERAADFLASEQYREQADASAARMAAIHAEIDSWDGDVLRRLPACIDPWKLPLFSDRVSGLELAVQLAAQGIDHEYVGWSSVLFVCSLANTADDQQFFGESLRAVYQQLQRLNPLDLPSCLPQRQPRVSVLPRDAFMSATTELIPLSEAEGRISAMTLRSDDAMAEVRFGEVMSGHTERTSLYDGLPPGTPILIPGEIISSWHLAAIHPRVQLRVLP